MELRRVAEALLRSQSSPIPAYLTPSLSKWQIIAQPSKTTRCATRAFTTSVRQYAIRPSVTTSQPGSRSTLEPKPTAPVSPNDLANDLNWLAAGYGGNRTSRYKSPKAQEENKGSLPNADRSKEEADMNGGHSAADLLSSFNQMKPRTQSGSFWDTMKSPSSMVKSNSSLMEGLADDMAPEEAPRVPLRLTPVIGRTVQIGANIDVARGFNLLNSSIRRNAVRHDFKKQLFHERGGLKRKRLRRERWRKRFMLGFKATVSRVKDLKKQGW